MGNFGEKPDVRGPWISGWVYVFFSPSRQMNYWKILRKFWADDINGMGWKGEEVGIGEFDLDALAILGKKKFVLLIRFESYKWDHYERHYEGYTLSGCISRYLD